MKCRLCGEHINVNYIVNHERNCQGYFAKAVRPQPKFRVPSLFSRNNGSRWHGHGGRFVAMVPVSRYN